MSHTPFIPCLAFLKCLFKKKKRKSFLWVISVNRLAGSVSADNGFSQGPGQAGKGDAFSQVETQSPCLRKVSHITFKLRI